MSRHDSLSLSLLSRKPSCLAVEVKAWRSSFVQGVGAFCLERALNSEGFPAFPHIIILNRKKPQYTGCVCCGLEPRPLDDARRSRVSSVEALPQCVCDQRVIANAIDFNCVFVLHVPCVPRGEARPGRQPARFPARAARGAFFDEPMTYLDR
mgnify:CR=1 FL=1